MNPVQGQFPSAGQGQYPCEFCGWRMTTEQNLKLHKWKHCKVLHPELAQQQQQATQQTGQFWHQQQMPAPLSQPFAKPQTLYTQPVGQQQSQVPQFVVPSLSSEPVPTQQFYQQQQQQPMMAALIQRAVREAMSMKEQQELDACASNDFPGRMPSLMAPFTFNPTANPATTTSAKTAANQWRIREFHLCPPCFDLSENALVAYTPGTGHSQHSVFMCSPCTQRYACIKNILDGKLQPVGMSITSEQMPPTTMDVTITTDMEAVNGAASQATTSNQAK